MRLFKLFINVHYDGKLAKDKKPLQSYYKNVKMLSAKSRLLKYDLQMQFAPKKKIESFNFLIQILLIINKNSDILILLVILPHYFQARECVEFHKVFFRNVLIVLDNSDHLVVP